MPGIIDIVSFKNNIAVIGKSTWEVMEARKLVKAKYEKDGNIESTADHDRIMSNLLDTGKATERRKDVDVDAAFK